MTAAAKPARSAEKAYSEATASAENAYDEAMVPAQKAFIHHVRVASRKKEASR